MQAKISLMGLIFLLAACGTPKEVKELSAAQVVYLDKAAEVVSSQSEALLNAAEMLKTQAEARIDARVASTTASNSNDMADMGSMTAEDAKAILESQANMATNAELEKQRLETSYQALKTKTEALATYMTKLSEVQQALNNYLLSEQAGEGFLQRVTGQTKVGVLLGKAETFLEKIGTTSSEITSLLNSLE